MPALLVLLVVLAAAACVDERPDGDMIQAVMNRAPCTRPIDSLALARAAIDTLARRDEARGLHTQWRVRRFESDSAEGIISVIARPHAPAASDAVGIVLMDCDGAAFEVILSDTINTPEA